MRTSHDGFVRAIHTERTAPLVRLACRPGWTVMAAESDTGADEAAAGRDAVTDERGAVTQVKVADRGETVTDESRPRVAVPESSSIRGEFPSPSPAVEVPLESGWQARALRVDRRVVLEHWYAREREKRGASPARRDPRGRPEDELLVPIVEAAGGGARPVCTECARWYRVRLAEPEFRRLRVIECPEGRCWNRLAPDDRLLTAARTLRTSARGVPRHLVDRDYVLELARRDIDMASATARDPPVLFSRVDDPEPRVIDGNHRAAATALALIACGEFAGMHAYLGVETSTSMGPLRSLACTLRSMLR